MATNVAKVVAKVPAEARAEAKVMGKVARMTVIKTKMAVTLLCLIAYLA